MGHQKIYSFFLFTIIGFHTVSFSQTRISGFVKSADSIGLADANILAIPSDSVGKTAFTISKGDGSYELVLRENAGYDLKVSFMGFITDERQIQIGKSDTNINFFLIEDLNELDEVVINYKPPIQIKKDTTTYQTDAFVDGSERKLREILERLPGIEVDKDGNVTSQGKKVTRVLVENKLFFNGRSKLAVNNIPADVVNEIQIIEDYHETEFLKGLEKSEEVAMNINLKEDKKKFIFGDIELAGGIKNRYIFHPTLFRYSPKLTFNFIGDINNTVEKSFTLADYIGFEGGLNDDTRNVIFKSNISKYLRNQDYISNTHKFSGLSSQYNPSDKFEWRNFIIGIDDGSTSRNENTFNYPSTNTVENRSLKNDSDNFILLAKSRLKYTPDRKTSISIEGSLERNTLGVVGRNVSTLGDVSTRYGTKNSQKSLTVGADVSVKRQFSKKHTTIMDANISLVDESNSAKWHSSDNLFSPQIPVVDDEYISVVQNEINRSTYFALMLKHFWVINRKNHLYLDYKSDFLDRGISTGDGQLLTDGSVYDFPSFANDLSGKYWRSKGGLEYKHIWDALIMSFIMGVEENKWRVNQELGSVDRSNIAFLPGLNLEYEFNNNESLRLMYQRVSQMPEFQLFLSNSHIRTFNNIFQGNPDLSPSFSNSYRIFYRRYRSYGWSFFPSIGYVEWRGLVTNKASIDGIFGVFSPVNLDKKNTNGYANFRVVKNNKLWKLGLNMDYRRTVSYIPINDNNERVKSNSINGTVDFKTNLENKPNINLSYSTSHTTSKSRGLDNIFQNDKINAGADYHFGDWKINLDYSLTFFKNEYSTISRTEFNLFNSSILYNKENSPWSFEFRSYNLFNNLSKRTTMFSPQLFSEEQIFTFPRTLTFHIIYKL